MRFTQNMSESEIGELLDVSQMRVSRIMRKALGKLLRAVRGEDEGEPQRT